MKLLFVLCVAVVLCEGLAQSRTRGRGLRRFNPTSETEAVEEEVQMAQETSPVATPSSSRSGRRPMVQRSRPSRTRTRSDSPTAAAKDSTNEVQAQPAPRPTSGGRRRRLRVPLKPTPVAPKIEEPVSEEPVAPVEEEVMSLMEDKPVMKAQPAMKDPPKVKEMKEAMPKEEVTEAPKKVQLVPKPVIKPLTIRITPRRSNSPAPKPKPQPNEPMEEDVSVAKTPSHRFASSPRIRGRGGSRSPAAVKATPDAQPETAARPIQASTSRRRLRGPAVKTEPTAVEDPAPQQPIEDSSRSVANGSPTTESKPVIDIESQDPQPTVLESAVPIAAHELVLQTELETEITDQSTPPRAQPMEDTLISSHPDEIASVLYEYYDDIIEDKMIPSAKTKKPPTTTAKAVPRIRIAPSSQRTRGAAASVGGSSRWDLVGTVEDTPASQRAQILSGLGGRRRGLSKSSRVAKPSRPQPKSKNVPADYFDYLYEDY